VLIVDDSRVIRRAAVKILQKDFDIIEAEDGEDAWDILLKNPKISVVFSDLGMPKMDGFELLERIRSSADEAIGKMPVIIITGAEESDGTKEKVLELGATDFIVKPFDSISLKTRASAHINYRIEVQELEKNIARDKLTGLLTEPAFTQQCEQQLAYARRHCTEVALVRLDIDHFAEVFVKQGQAVSEKILKKVATFINEGKRIEDVAARVGVARFSLLLPNSDMLGAEAVVKRICQQVSRLKLKTGKDMYKIQFSAGITAPGLVETGVSFNRLLKQAESALKISIDNGGGNIIRFEGKGAAEKTKSRASVKQANKVASNHADVDLQRLLDSISGNMGDNIKDELLTSAMYKIIPLIAEADNRLKLGLGKVVAHLKKRLK